MPFDFDMDSMSPVESGGGGEEYGASVETFIGEADNNGVLQLPSTGGDVEITDAEDVANDALRSKFYKSAIDSFSLPDVTSISGSSALKEVCFSCPNLKSVNLSSLKTISGSNAMLNGFTLCSNLEAINLSSLEEITGDSAVQECFRNDTSLTSVSFPKLKKIQGTSAAKQLFYECSSLSSINFPELEKTEGSTYPCASMLSYTGIRSINFPKLKEADLSGFATNCVSLETASFPLLEKPTGTNMSLNGMFKKCTSLRTVSFTSLSLLKINNAMTFCCDGCTNIEDVYFNALTTSSFGSYKNQFNNFLVNTGTQKVHTLHFPSNLEAKIATLTGYPNFGGTSGYVTLAFDLDETS